MTVVRYEEGLLGFWEITRLLQRCLNYSGADTLRAGSGAGRVSWLVPQPGRVGSLIVSCAFSTRQRHQSRGCPRHQWSNYSLEKASPSGFFQLGSGQNLAAGNVTLRAGAFRSPNSVSAGGLQVPSWAQRIDQQG